MAARVPSTSASTPSWPANTISDDYYPKLAGILFELAVRLHKRHRRTNQAYINLSGGVGIAYRPDQTAATTSLAIGEGVRKKFEEILVPAGMGDVAIFTEMGRFTTGTLRRTGRHRASTRSTSTRSTSVVDACAANLMRPAMYGAYHHITVLGKEDAPCDHKYDVVGGLCENNDKFAIDRMLPKIDIGDIVYIHDTGAHGFCDGLQLQRQAAQRRGPADARTAPTSSSAAPRRPRDYFATFDFSPFFKK